MIITLCRQILGSRVKIGQSRKLKEKRKLRTGIANKPKPIKKIVFT
jgi:hypothetical protein